MSHRSEVNDRVVGLLPDVEALVRGERHLYDQGLIRSGVLPLAMFSIKSATYMTAHLIL